MTYVRAWHAPALRLAEEGKHVLMDHGPVFRLAFLDEFGSPLTQSPAFQRWWQESLALWAGTLDLLICLNAPDDVLIQRVRGRDLGHALKSKTPLDARSFLGRYRTGFERVIDRFAAAARPRVLRIDTSRTPVDEVATRVFDALGELSRAA